MYYPVVDFRKHLALEGVMEESRYRKNRQDLDKFKRHAVFLVRVFDYANDALEALFFREKVEEVQKRFRVLGHVDYCPTAGLVVIGYHVVIQKEIWAAGFHCEKFFQKSADFGPGTGEGHIVVAFKGIGVG